MLDRLHISSLGAVVLAGGFVSAYVLATAEPPAILGWASLVVAFAIGYWLRDLEIFWVCWCGLCVVYIGLHILFGPIVTANYVGCFVALGLAGALAYRLWWYLPAAAAGLWLFQSRGAIIGAAVAMILALGRYSRYLAFLLTLATIVAVFWISDGRDNGILARLGIWQDTLDHLIPVGHGYGSFAKEYALWPIHRNMTLILAPHAYNDFLEIASDFGLFAIPLWFMVALCLDGTDWRILLIAATFGGLGLTFFPFYIPGLGQAFALVLGHSLAIERKSYGTLAPNSFALH